MSDPVVNEIRAGERAVPWQTPDDARLIFIGRIHTPWTARQDCPRQGAADGPLCRIELLAPWDQALDGVEACEKLQVFYWLDQARRDLVAQKARGTGEPRGTFALRSPNRPNPIGESIVTLERVEEDSLYVRGLDCIDGTPLIDIKPDRSTFRRWPETPERNETGSPDKD